jgi:hypothetical protein
LRCSTLFSSARDRFHALTVELDASLHNLCFASCASRPRADRYVNLAMGGLLLLGLVQVGAGGHKLIVGYGKKEGF